MIAPEAGLSVSRQCALLAVACSSFYYRPRPECAEELELLRAPSPRTPCASNARSQERNSSSLSS
jgi:hypothetical protein